MCLGWEDRTPLSYGSWFTDRPRCPASVERGWFPRLGELSGRSYHIASNLRRTIHMFTSANSMCSCALFLPSPR